MMRVIGLIRHHLQQSSRQQKKQTKMINHHVLLTVCKFSVKRHGV